MASCRLKTFRNHTSKDDVYVKNHESGQSFTLKAGEVKEVDWPVPDASSLQYLEEGRYLEFRFACSYWEDDKSRPVDSGHKETQILVYRDDHAKRLRHVVRYDGEI